MLSKGVPVKDICRKLKVTPQTVYNVRYHMNKKRAVETGIKKLASKPTDEHA
jgi:DNA-binding CsgD family transcriptional regulator